MLVEYCAAVHPPRSIKMLPADDREFPDVFLSVGGVWLHSQVEFVSNLTATIQGPWAKGIESVLPGNLSYLIPRARANLKADLRSSRLLG